MPQPLSGLVSGWLFSAAVESPITKTVVTFVPAVSNKVSRATSDSESKCRNAFISFLCIVKLFSGLVLLLFCVFRGELKVASVQPAEATQPKQVQRQEFDTAPVRAYGQDQVMDVACQVEYRELDVEHMTVVLA